MCRFAPFNRIDLPYSVINGVPLLTTILIPDQISTTPRNDGKKYPVMVRWHGGGFVVGHRMYEPWFAQWLLDMALDRDAIIITADYRLMPESNGSEILSDVAHFWRWLQKDWPLYMQQSNLPRPDISNVLCCGESSGGFISVYCALHLESMLQQDVQDDVSALAPAWSSDEKEAVKKMMKKQEKEEQVRIRAIISISAPLDATSPEYKIPRPRVFIGRSPPSPRQALATIRAYTKAILPGNIRTECEPTPEMWELLLCITQQALLPRLFGKSPGEEGRSTLESLMETLDQRDESQKMVPVWIVHGTDDTMCPPVCSSGFASRLQEVQPEVPMHLSLCPGEHLFDVDMTRDADWIREGEKFVHKYWAL